VRIVRHARRAACVLALAAAVSVLAACGGNGGGSTPAGTYSHPDEGEIVLSEDGSGTVDNGSVPITWTADGDTVTLDAGNGQTVDATLEDDNLVFEPGVYGCCEDEDAVFVRQ
jgi:hypothetical protein